jgi:RNA polymerase sigma factor (sigma-70 family)
MLPEQLLQEIASGNQASLKKLYTVFKDKVYNTALAYLQHTEEAEEATQDVFIEIYESASTFKATSSVSTWIYRITVNKCLDRLRHQKRQKRFAFITSIFKQDSSLRRFAFARCISPSIAFCCHKTTSGESADCFHTETGGRALPKGDCGSNRTDRKSDRRADAAGKSEPA